MPKPKPDYPGILDAARRIAEAEAGPRDAEDRDEMDPPDVDAPWEYGD
jgi:hypothetical protein